MHCSLRGAINRRRGERDESQAGRDVDDQRTLAGFEMRQELLHHPHWPVQVDLDLARYVVQIVSLIEIQVAHDAGVVDERIERGKLRD
jgi:hypothetical protein